MKIDFERYKVKFPKRPKVSGVRKLGGNRYYRKMMRDMRRNGVRK